MFLLNIWGTRVPTIQEQKNVRKKEKNISTTMEMLMSTTVKKMKQKEDEDSEMLE